jgi:16S rRNA (guanine527-N7)-methyltransferase
MARRPAPSDPISALAADRATALAMNPVSRETLERLDAYVALLLQWQQTTNLIAPATIPVLWTRHVVDSLQLLDARPEARHWIDLGSGGGFPGLVLACTLADRSGASVHLVESNGKKAAFLRETARVLKLPARVHAERIEEFVASYDGPADVVTARALAPLVQLLGYAFPLLKRGACGLFPKGQDVETELTDAAKCWTIRAKLLPSRTDPRARLVLVEHAEPKL